MYIYKYLKKGLYDSWLYHSIIANSQNWTYIQMQKLLIKFFKIKKNRLDVLKIDKT